MKIYFIATNQNICVGSYRIWVRDLSRTLNSLGHDCKIVKTVIEIPKEAEMVILSKNDYHLAESVANTLNCIVGCINLAADIKNKFIDFIITGSIEESISLSAYDNVFLYPLIELDYENISPKQHTENNTIKICFHGHYPHLSKFNPHLKQALEIFAQETKIELHVITGSENFTWNIGRPNVPIIYKHWNHKNFVHDIQQCDIGVIPNVTDLNAYIPQLRATQSRDQGWYHTDYNIRFKNKSNAGRAFVFYQLGIPVIADLTPSNLHILGDTSCGYCAHNSHSWLRALRQLKSHNLRRKVSLNARNAFKRLYDPCIWAQKLIEQINGSI